MQSWYPRGRSLYCIECYMCVLKTSPMRGSPLLQSKAPIRELNLEGVSRVLDSTEDGECVFRCVSPLFADTRSRFSLFFLRSESCFHGGRSSSKLPQPSASKSGFRRSSTKWWARPRILPALFYTMSIRALETRSSFDNLWTKHDMEMKLTSIDFSRWVTEGYDNSWLQSLGITNLSIIPHTLGILTMNITDCVVLFE